jgi:hypothetical protein
MATYLVDMAVQDGQAVYVIQHELGPVKIGIALKPEKRLSELQVSCPFQLTLKKTKRPRNAKRVEKHLHDHFEKYHMRGEWFDLPVDVRDFEIPRKIEAGRAIPAVEVSDEREINKEWADSLERFVIAMKVSKYKTPELEEIRGQWREYYDPKRDSIEDTRPNTAEGLHDVTQDTPNGQVRCSQCGHHYDRSEFDCPICGGASSTSGHGGPNFTTGYDRRYQ